MMYGTKSIKELKQGTALRKAKYQRAQRLSWEDAIRRGALRIIRLISILLAVGTLVMSSAKFV